MAATLAERLRRRIRRDGPMDFADWMAACLYDAEDGYYMRPGTRIGTGPGSDFATSPALHPFLAHCAAREALAVARRTGAPVQVAEFGGGTGALARDALQALHQEAPEASWLHVEASPAHRALQAEGDEARMSWADGLPPGFSGMVWAHEFVDALPFSWLERRGGAWQAIQVDVDGDRFVERLGEPTRAALAAAPQAGLPDGWRVAAMAAARQWIGHLAEQIGDGEVLIVDYGDEGERLWRRDRSGTVRGFRRHRLVADVLGAAPGTVDLTASVDFGLLAQWGKEAGLEPAGLETQEAFLLRHGVLEALNTTDRSTVEGASAYLRLRRLLLPMGAGVGDAFRVLRLVRRRPREHDA